MTDSPPFPLLEGGRSRKGGWLTTQTDDLRRVPPTPPAKGGEGLGNGKPKRGWGGRRPDKGLRRVLPTPPAKGGEGLGNGKPKRGCGGRRPDKGYTPRRPHYGVKRQSLQNALSTHHTRHPRPRRQAQPYLAEETDTDARRRGRRGGTPTGGRGRNARDTTPRRPRPPRGAPKAPKRGEQRGRAARGRLRATAPAPQGRPPNGRAGRGGSRSPPRTRAPDRTDGRTRGGRPPPPRPQK